MIKQALGYGALEQAKVSQEEDKKSLVGFLETLLTPLLPTKQAIRRKLEKTIGDSVELANGMACEQALYHWQIIPIGSVADEKRMEWSNTEQRGRVFLCTFPMCWKEVREEDGQKQVCLVKADVELEHSLGNIVIESL
jgi:hypothetical protein